MKCKIQNCNNDLMYYSKDNFWFCSYHGKQNVKSRNFDLNNFDLKNYHLTKYTLNYPYPISLIVFEYEMESNFLIKLHRYVDGIEILIRFFTAILLSNILKNDNKFSEKIKKLLSLNIVNPSTAQWKELLAGALESSKTFFMTELHDYIKNNFFKILGDNNGSVEQNIIPLRNYLIHNSRNLTEIKIKELLDVHNDIFNKIVQDLNFLEKYEIFGSLSNSKLIKFKGFPDIEGNFPIIQCNEKFSKSQLLLKNENNDYLEIIPLITFSEILITNKNNKNYSLNIYFRLNNANHLEYISFNENKSFFNCYDNNHIFQKFQDIFKIEEWKYLNNIKKTIVNFKDQIETYCQEKSFFGRENEIKEIKNKLREINQGLLWLGGKPGIGKTTIMANLLKQLTNEKNYLIIPYFFCIGKLGCSFSEFLQYTFLLLENYLEEKIDIPKGLNEQKILWHKKINELSENNNKKLILLIDGLDEINKLSSNFKEFITNLYIKNTIILCSGRNENELESFLKNKDSNFLYPNGIHTLSKKSIEKILISSLDISDLKYKYIHNEHILEIIKNKSQGYPLYIQMLITDMKNSKVSIENIEQLPTGLENYLDKTLSNLHISDKNTLITPFLCLLAVSDKELSKDKLEKLLSDIPIFSNWEEQFSKVLELLDSVINISFRNKKTMISIYHNSLREKILSSEKLKTNINWAKEAFKKN